MLSSHVPNREELTWSLGGDPFSPALKSKSCGAYIETEDVMLETGGGTAGRSL